MSHRTSIRQALTVAGATGILAFSVAAPASARPDPGELFGSGGTTSRPDGSILQNPPASDSSITTPGPVTVRIDDNAVEVLQLGAGVLAGVALAGAGLAVASRRSHRHAAQPV
jgi:hypothetical protein